MTPDQRRACRETLQTAKIMLAPRRPGKVTLAYRGKTLMLRQSWWKLPSDNRAAYWMYHVVVHVTPHGIVRFGSSRGALTAVLRCIQGPKLRRDCAGNPWSTDGETRQPTTGEKR